MTTIPNTPELAGRATSTGRTNTMAIISLIAGAVSVFGHLAIPGLGGGALAIVAIATGLIARGEIKRSGEQGMWMATVGIVLGAIHVALIALIVIVLVAAVFFLGSLALLHH
ncbi:MAG: hypothetical protein AUG05_01655 [Actinobacteria bacterium 13_1_20CM_2_66_18]|nr:MAG: hypothetical protein AUG05_01655 [Actinobacteria bacterium 13_1_20CM_2_66_18]